ncbi:galactose-3-O-sulfotransferase 2 [Carassius auratus]|uniref:Galactose-3-O-sulfotransferase 2 n=1 Tax=Carassius auratus TaxID=7957 RepID=A0A6P6QWH1_CARAU|nr:galactose-3-O-sulfotransferase 2-like [Carassius auratus]
MLPPQRIAGRERRAFHWRTASPWTTCVRVACCSRLRFMWFALMVLTVLCVALQMLGVVRQARSAKVLKIVSEQLVRMPPEIHRPIKHNDWENLWSVSAAIAEEPVDQHPFIQRRDESENPRSEERIEEVLEDKIKKLTSTTKAAPPIEANKLWLGQEFPNQPQRPAFPRRAPEIKITPYSDDNKYRVKSQVDNTVTCQPKNHIVFLKTHKTASSTILNILYRYGESHNLTFALPLNMHSQLFYPAFFAAHFVEGVRTRSVKKFHILCNHMRFSSQEVRKVMPKDTFYFSILRNPVAMMESLFVYYKAIPAFRTVKSLEDFLIHGGRSYNASVPNNHYARNILTFDFGLDNTAPVNDTELDRRSTEVIAAIERDFPLILISEYFDESLVLLKHALCWTLDEVSSFRLNSRSERSRRPLSAETTERIKEWNSLDWRLYQHFNNTFWKRIDSTLGRAKLQQEVELLRAKRRNLEQMCLQEGGAVDPAQVQDSSLKPFQYGAAVIQGYNLRLELNNDTRQLCQRLITPELQYTSALYTKQFPQLAAARATAAKKIAASRNTATHRAVKRNIETNVHTAMPNNTSHNNTNKAIVDEHSLHILAYSVVQNERQNSFDVTRHYKEIKRNSHKHTARKHFINSNIHKEPQEPGLLR